MKIFIILFSVLFFISGLLFHQEKTSESFVSVYAALLQRYFSTHVIFVLFGIIALIIIGIRLNTFDTKHTLIKKSLFTFLQVILSAFLGFYISFIGLLLLAIIELNIFAVLFNIKPSVIGVETERSKIVMILKSTLSSPQIITSDKNLKDVLKAVAVASAGKTTFFGNFIVESVPHFLILPVDRSDSVMFLLADTLIITELKPKDIEAVSPYLGYHLVKRYFPRRVVKSYPTISTLERDNYIAFRTLDAKEKVRKIEEQIQIVVNSINSTSSMLRDDKPALALHEATLLALKEEEKAAFTQCMNEGTYVNGVFQRVTSEELCSERTSQLQKEINDEKKVVEIMTIQIKNNEEKLKELERYANIFVAQINAVQNTKENFPHEYGVFVPAKTIRIAVDTQSPDSLLDYLGTLTHEYLHYASYVSESKKFKDLFFEEGLTEYYARQIIQYDFQKNVNLGYPVFVRIIRQMMEIIPESELSEIYFTKDQEALERVLNRVYGDNFYDETRILFSTLQYASDEKQVLDLANTIMKKIDGEPLTEKDLESQESSF